MNNPESQQPIVAELSGAMEALGAWALTKDNDADAQVARDKVQAVHAAVADLCGAFPEVSVFAVPHTPDVIAQPPARVIPFRGPKQTAIHKEVAVSSIEAVMASTPHVNSAEVKIEDTSVITPLTDWGLEIQANDEERCLAVADRQLIGVSDMGVRVVELLAAHPWGLTLPEIRDKLAPNTTKKDVESSKIRTAIDRVQTQLSILGYSDRLVLERRQNNRIVTQTYVLDGVLYGDETDA